LLFPTWKNIWDMRWNVFIRTKNCWFRHHHRKNLLPRRLNEVARVRAVRVVVPGEGGALKEEHGATRHVVPVVN
jgi:hypothetical protein